VDEKQNNEAAAKVAGLLRQVQDFSCLFHVYLLQAIFEKTGILHKTLKSSKLDISTALDLAGITIQQLVEMKNDNIIRDDLFE